METEARNEGAKRGDAGAESTGRRRSHRITGPPCRGADLGDSGSCVKKVTEL